MAGDLGELIELAVSLYADGEFDQASGILRTLVQRDPGDAAIWDLLARCELAAERYEPALEAAARASELQPAWSMPHQLASFALLRLGRRQDAVERARQGVRADPSDWRALGTLALLLAAAGSDPAETRDLTARMVKLAADEPDAHEIAGMVAAASGDRERARTSFLEVLRLDPGSAAAQHELARLRLKRRNDPAALAEAAAGFARAAESENSDRSQRSLDLVLRAFLSKAAWLLLVAAWVVGRTTVDSETTAARLAPLVVVAAAGIYGWRFLIHLTPPVGRHLRQTLKAPGPLRVAAIFELLALLGIGATAVAPSQHVRRSPDSQPSVP